VFFFWFLIAIEKKEIEASKQAAWLVNLNTHSQLIKNVILFLL
jgi:hypothetical protein